MWCPSLARILIALLLVGLALVPSIVRPPSAAAAPPCPEGTVTLRDLIRMSVDRGPILERHPGLDAISVSERAAACFGSRTLRVTAFVADGIIGDVTPWSIRPRWMAGVGLFLFPERRLANHGEFGLGPSLMAAMPPALGDLQRRYRNRWVVVTGRYNDAIASSCRPTGVLTEAPSRREATRICRGIFVVSSVALLGAPATATDPAAPPLREGHLAGWLALAAGLGVILAAWLRERMRHLPTAPSNGRARSSARMSTGVGRDGAGVERASRSRPSRSAPRSPAAVRAGRRSPASRSRP